MSKIDILFVSGVLLLDGFVLLCFASVFVNVVTKQLGINMTSTITLAIEQYFKSKQEFLVKLSKEIPDDVSGQKNRSSFN